MVLRCPSTTSSSSSPLCFDFLLLSSSLPSSSQSTTSHLCCCCDDSFFTRTRKRLIVKNVRWAQACISGGNPHHLDAAARRGAKSIVLNRFADQHQLENDSSSSSASAVISSSSYYSPNFGQEDPIVDKLRDQLGVIHPIPSPPINRNIFGLFAFFFFVGVAFDKVWASSRRRRNAAGGVVDQSSLPTSLSMFLDKDLQRKESVEWVNMVLGKLWKVYRGGIENWIIGLLQPVIDNLKKPDYVKRVEIKQFSLGEEPLSVRSVERRTSRRANDLQLSVSPLPRLCLFSYLVGYPASYTMSC